MRRALLLVVTVALGLAACGGGDDGDAAGSTTTEATTTTEAPASSETTASTAPTTAAPSAPTAFTTEPRDAANELKAAWEAGDQARARAIAPGEAVDALFAVPPGGFEVYGCDSGRFDTSTCNFRNRSTGVFITVASQRSDAGWQISTVNVSQD